MRVPSITIGMPVYNGAEFLDEAIQSVLAQTHGDFELLISEGGSTDGTRAIIEKYAAIDPRVRYERTESRIAQVPNCNRVVELARAEWVQFLCHDDILFPWALRSITQACLTAPASVGLVGHDSPNYFQSRYVAIGGEVLAPEEIVAPGKHAQCLFPGRAAASRILRLGASPLLPSLTSATVRRKALLDIGGFDARFAQFDTRAWCRLLLRNDFIRIPSALSLTRIHQAQVTTVLSGRVRTVEDSQVFWPEWIEEARSLGFEVPVRAQALPWLKTSMEAASQLWACYMRGGVAPTWAMLRSFRTAHGLGALLLLPRAASQDRYRKKGVPQAYGYLRNG